MGLGTEMKLALANRFHLKVTNKSVWDLGSWAKVEGLDVKWDVCEYRAGDAGNHRWYFPGNTSYQTVKLSRAACADSKTVQAWLKDNSTKYQVGTLATLFLYGSNPDEGSIIDWELKDIMPTHWSIVGFEASQGKVALETLELAHLGFLDDEFKLEG